MVQSLGAKMHDPAGQLQSSSGGGQRVQTAEGEVDGGDGELLADVLQRQAVAHDKLDPSGDQLPRQLHGLPRGTEVYRIIQPYFLQCGLHALHDGDVRNDEGDTVIHGVLLVRRIMLFHSTIRKYQNAIPK